MDSKQLRDMHGRISHGFDLTREEARWLWNMAADACNDPEYSETDAVFCELGQIPPTKIRCETCNCTGLVGVHECGVDIESTCPVCSGSGFVERTT